MINICICDDSEQDIDLLKGEIEKYEEEKGVFFNTASFSKPELVIYELQENRVADIYFLDVSMPEKNGFELAEEIRRYSDSAIIIFLTSLEDQAIKGYKSRALRYIVKLNLKRDIGEALDSAVDEISGRDDKIVTIHRYSDFWRVFYRDIIYVSRMSRRLVVVTFSQGELTDGRGITDFYRALDDGRFLFIDRGCFVNVDYITQISGCDIRLKDGTVLPVSRRCLSTVKQVLLERWSK